jgi:hypothetical protein
MYPVEPPKHIGGEVQSWKIGPASIDVVTEILYQLGNLMGTRGLMPTSSDLNSGGPEVTRVRTDTL